MKNDFIKTSLFVRFMRGKILDKAPTLHVAFLIILSLCLLKLRSTLVCELLVVLHKYGCYSFSIFLFVFRFMQVCLFICLFVYLRWNEIHYYLLSFDYLKTIQTKLRNNPRVIWLHHPCLAKPVLLIIQNKSQRKILNKKGPRINPCGAPNKNSFQKLYAKLILVLYFLFER